MSFCNFNSKSNGRRYDFFFHLNTALPFPVQNLVQRLRSQTPSSVSSTPNEVSAIPCELFGNTLRTLFLKNRDFFWYCEIFLLNTRGSLGCLLGFWPSGPNPCGGNNGGCVPPNRLRMVCGTHSNAVSRVTLKRRIQTGKRTVKKVIERSFFQFRRTQHTVSGSGRHRQRKTADVPLR